MNRVTAAIEEYSQPWMPPISDTFGPRSLARRDERRMLDALEVEGAPLDHVASWRTSGVCGAGGSRHAK